MTRQSGFGRPGSQRALFPRSFYAVTAFLISWSCGLLSVAHLNAATIVSELGAAGPANFTVLSLGGNTGQINFTGSGTINGNAGMPNSGEYIASGSADLTGILYLGSQSSKKISGSAKIQGGTQQNTKSNSLLNSAVQAADAASSYFAGLPPTPVSITCTPKCTSLPFQTMGSGAKFTITGTKAVNVLDLKGINIPHGATVTFYSKVAGAEFVINNSGPFQIGSDVTITVAGTVSPYAVVLNHTGNEEAQISSGSILTGIILAPIAAIQIESATFTGEVIGGKNAAVQISGQTKLVQPSIAVPNVVGATQSAATTDIEAVGLILGTVTTASSPTVPSGDVISESPIAGKLVKPGSAVNLVVSSGPAEVAVPNVVGSTQAAATSAIKAAGLIVGTVTTAPSSTIPSGSVISENPTAGTMVNAGSAVNLVISSGPGQVAVPNVVGSTQAAATTTIQNAGLVVGTVTTQSSSTVPSGDVISETPTAGTMVNAGSAVNLVISSGPAQVAVPNVVGSTQAAATSAIKAAGLVVGTITTAPSNTVPSGSVISESPTAGTMVNVGSAVNLVVSSGPGQVSVPNVVGSTQAAATTAIQNAGLVVGTVTTHSSSTVPSGDVISETPSAGTMVNAGSAVNLVISSGPAQVAVPNVVGSTQAAATTAIQNAGLVVGTVTTASSSTVPSGDVISETPSAGTMVNAGSAVNLVISSGPAQVAVPNVVGSSQAAATTAIQSAGLVVGTVTTASSSTVPSGDVISETPSAGTMVNTGSAVNLVISTGAAPISITGFSPQSGPIGTLVNVTLTNFAPVQGTTPQVALASANGGSINAPVSTQAANALSFVIPAGAATGKFSVTFGGQTATSSAAFSVSTSSSFTLSVGPSTASLIPGQSVSYAVTVNSSNGFDALANLSITGVPSGVTSSFSPTGVTAGQTSVLTLSAPANQATSTTNLSISASATIQGQTVSQSQNATLQVTAITTSFLGRTVVDDTQQTPIAGVTVKFLGVDAQGSSTGCSAPPTTSDAAGNFSFTSLPQSCTGPQLISYNGMTATAPAGKYAGVNLSYTLTSGQVTTSPVLIHLPRIDNGETVQVQQNASTNQVFTFQSIPGLLVTVYAGTTFSLDDGTQPNPFPLIAVEIPLDRLPDQMPTSGMLTPFIVAFQPANAVASQPVAVNFPNSLGFAPGTHATFMTLDPTRGFMVPYGTGAVSNDGTQFVADPDPAHPGHAYGLVHFDWHGPSAPPPNNVNPGPGGGPPPPSPPCSSGCPCPDPGACQVAGPVDLASGIVTYTTTDLAINGGRGSISIMRTYRTLSTNTGPFGIGTSHNYGYSLSTLAYIDGGAVITLAMPDGNQFPFSQTQGGTFVNTTIPSLRGAVLTANGPSGPYVLRWAEGTQYQFTVFTTLGFAGAFLTSITDPNGNTTTLSLNSSQPTQLLQVTDPVGRSLSLTYDSSNRVTSISDPTGRKVSYTYNSQGELATFTDAMGGVTRYTYDVQTQNLATVTDPRGIMVEQNFYDPYSPCATLSDTYSGRVTRQVEADGGVYHFQYILVGCIVTGPVLGTTVTDPNGNTTTYRFTPEGLITSVQDATGQQRNFVRDPDHNNLVTAYTGVGICPVCGNPTIGDINYTFDAFGNVLTKTDSLGNTTRFSYDSRFNKPTSITDPLGHVTLLTYDAAGNLLTISDANSHSILYTYNSFGQVIQVTDPASYKTTLAYNTFGDLISIKDPLGNSISLGYDALSRNTQTVDALGRKTSTQFDNLDRVTLQTNPKGISTQFSYDQIGSLLSAVDGRGNELTMTYDAVGRLLAKTDQLGRSDQRSYDADGNLIAFVDRRGQKSNFLYDSLNRLITSNYQDGSVVTRSYDTNSRLMSVIDSTGGNFGFTYDASGHLLSQTSPVGSVQYTRDAIGRVVTRQVVGQSMVTYAYDRVGNLLSVTAAGASVQFTFNERNLPITMSRSNGITSTYTYDPLGRLLSFTHMTGTTPINTQLYSYDADGYRLSTSNDISGPLIAQPAVASVDKANELLSFGSTTYTYDANGNRLSEAGPNGTFSYVWDSRNRLTSITDGQGNATALHYDYLQNVLEVDRTTNGATTAEQFVIDSLTNVVAVTGPSGLPSSVLTGVSLDSHYATIDSSGNVAFGITDALGSIVGVTNGVGTLASKISYDPYGATTGTTAYPFSYTGRVPVLGNIYYYRHRFYDAGAGRFLSEDPLGLGGGNVNFYSYVGGNPTSFSDPQGEFLWIIAGGVIGGAINAGITYVANNGNVSAQQLGAAFAGGFVAGALGAAAGPLGGTLALELGLGSSSGLGAVAAAGLLSAGASAAGQEVSNLIDPCHQGNLADAALWGGIGGSAGKFFPTKNLNSWAQASTFGPSSITGLFGSSNAWTNLGSFGTSAGLGAASNFPAVDPF